MFTETPPSGRRVRGKPPASRQSMGPPQFPPPSSTTIPQHVNPTQSQQPQQTTSSTLRKQPIADHPATPLASVGPPNFSYGSATHALPRKISLADTKMSIFAAMNKAAKDAHERDVRAGKAGPEPEGQHPLVRFYEEPLSEIPTGPVDPPKIRAIKDNPPRSSPRRSTRRSARTPENRDESIDSDLLRRTPTPTPSEESEQEKTVTHVLVRESASPAKRASPVKTRRTAAKTPKKAEITLDSSNYEFSKDYSEEERAYKELRGKNGTHRAAISIKETHYEEDEDEEEDEEDESSEEKEEGEDEEDEDYEEHGGSVIEYDMDDNVYQYDEPEDFIIQPQRSILTSLKNFVFFIVFFVQNLISTTYHGIKSFLTRLVELFIYTPILFIVDSFKSLFRSISHGINILLSPLGTHTDLLKKIFAATMSVFLLILATPPALQFLQSHNVLDALSHFRLPIPGSYIPPELPPSTAEEIVDRLLDLERQLSQYSSLSHKLVQQNKALHQESQDERVRRAAIDDSIYLLKQELEKLNTFAKNSASQIHDLKQFHKDTRASLKEISNNILHLDNELATHESSLKSAHGKSDTSTTEIKHLKSNIDALRKGVNHVKSELKRLSDFDYISKIAIKGIQEWLPDQLAVRVNPRTRKIEATPEFWGALKAVFADRAEMEKSVARQASKIADAKIVHREVSWNEFLRGNEEAIKGFIKVQMDDRWNQAGEEGVVVSRDYFLEILREQIVGLQGEMEGKMKGLMEKFDRTAKDNLAKAMQSAEAAVKKAKKSGKMDLSNEAMNSIVETALHLYAADTLAKPDYAAYSSGARINPGLTSPTYYHAPKSFVKRLGSYVFGGAGSTWGHQPAMALFQDTTVGMCWAFPGSQGGLGIRLSEPILVSDVSVEHVHRDVSKNIGSAPRQWSLYALINDDTARTQIENINAGLYESLPPANLPRGYTLLVKGEYNVNNDEGKTIQTVPVPVAIRRLNVPVEQVVYAVASNWGNEEYTCLYRVRVHGQGLHQDENENKGFGDDEVL